MKLTGMEEEGTEILAENIQKNNWIRNIYSQTEDHEQIIWYKSGGEYMEWTYLA
jgi:hypothetical protein